MVTTVPPRTIISTTVFLLCAIDVDALKIVNINKLVIVFMIAFVTLRGGKESLIAGASNGGEVSTGSGSDRVMGLAT